MTTALLITLAIFALLGVFAISIFNRLIALGRRCDQAGADIDVQVKQRFDLIPNLVETVKGYATHERGTLEAVMKARAATQQATSPVAIGQAEAALGSALGRLMAVAEAYPDLKASQNFSELQAELSDLENKIAAARRYLNSAVTEYNTTREQFPANLVSELFAFSAKDAVVMTRDERPRMEAAPAVRF
jgi:LemA protein